MVVSFDQQMYEVIFTRLDDYLGDLADEYEPGRAETKAAVEQLLKRVEDGVYWEDEV